MRSRRLSAHDGQETFVLVFDAGDEAIEGLTAFAREQRLTAAQFSGIGGFRRVTLGYFDWDEKAYQPIRVDEQVEVLALVGDVALSDDEPAVHAHVVVAGRDGAARGGHLLEGRVRPTLEIVLTESPAHLRKRYDPSSGLALIALDDDGDAAAAPQGETNLPHVPDEEAGVVGPQAQQIIEEEAATPRSSAEEGTPP